MSGYLQNRSPASYGFRPFIRDGCRKSQLHFSTMNSMRPTMIRRTSLKNLSILPDTHRENTLNWDMNSPGRSLNRRSSHFYNTSFSPLSIIHIDRESAFGYL